MLYGVTLSLIFYIFAVMNSVLTILLISLIQLLSSPEDIELVFAGDAMQHGPQISSALQPDGSYDYSRCFELVKDEISSADYAAVNLECPLGASRTPVIRHSVRRTIMHGR